VIRDKIQSIIPKRGFGVKAESPKEICIKMIGKGAGIMKIIKRALIFLIVLSMALLVACNQGPDSGNGNGGSQPGSFDTPLHPLD
jgi:hypothetical protein